MIMGPYSADNENAVCDCVSRLVRVQEEVKDKLMIIPRIYTNKPRETGEGYKVWSTNQNQQRNQIW